MYKKKIMAFVATILTVTVVGCGTSLVQPSVDAGTRLLVGLSWKDTTGIEQDFYYALNILDQQGSKRKVYIYPSKGQSYAEITELPQGTYNLESWSALPIAGTDNEPTLSTSPHPIYLTFEVTEGEVRVLSNQLSIRRYDSESAWETDPKMEPLTNKVQEKVLSRFKKANPSGWIVPENAVTGERYQELPEKKSFFESLTN